MNECNEYGYIKMPLLFIRMLLVKPKEAEHVARYCIYAMAVKADADLTNIMRQVIYEFLHDNNLPAAISDEIAALVRAGTIEIDTDRNGFDGEGDWTDDGVSVLSNYATEHEAFLRLCATWYKIRQTCKLSQMPMEEITLYEKSYNRYENLSIDDETYAFVGTSTMQEYIKLSKARIVPEFERVQFACYCAMRSIIGMKDYNYAKKDLILARMLGLKSSHDLTPDFLDKHQRAEAKRLFNKYSKRRQFQNLLNDMMQYKYLKCCFSAQKRGYCVSIKYDEQTVKTFAEDDYRTKLESRYRVQDSTREFAQRKKDIRKQVKLEHKPIPF